MVKYSKNFQKGLRGYFMENIVVNKVMDNLFNGYFMSGQVARDGSLTLIYRNYDENYNEINLFESSMLPGNYTIYILKGTNIRAINLKNIPIIPYCVDIFSDDTLLVVQSRCEKDGMLIEQNAHIYDWKGEPLSAFTVGDGIEHVQIDSGDNIWVGYFDEGIFGDFGWEEEPMGQEGLIVFNRRGKKIWEATDYDITDCCMLNVTHNDEVYFQYYDDLSLVKLQQFEEVENYRVQNYDSFDQFLCVNDEIIAQVDIDLMAKYKIKDNMLIQTDSIQFLDTMGNRCSGELFMRNNIIYILNESGVFVNKFK